jgi:hypothetical protein
MISLKQYLEEKIATLETRLNEKFADSADAVRTAYLAIQENTKTHADAHAREHQASKDATAKAEEVLDIRLASANRYQEQITEQAKSFARQDSLQSETKRLETLIGRIDDETNGQFESNASRISTLERSMISIQGSIAELVAITADVRELREWKSTSAGRGAVIGALVSTVIAIVASVVVGLILFVARGN